MGVGNLPKWLEILVNSAVTLTATFVGVLAAQTFANEGERTRQLQHFNSIFRIMGQDCQRTHEIIKASKPDADFRTAWLTPPAFTWNSAYNDAVVLTQVDPERMSKLTAQIRDVDAAYARYYDFAYEYRYVYIMPETMDRNRAAPPPPPSEEAMRYLEATQYMTDTCQIVGDRCINAENKEEAKPALRAKLEEYHKAYIDSVAATCSVFFDLVQK
jgi:hypothetical protein